MEAIEQMTSQSESLTQSFRLQILRLQEEHQSMLELLHQRIDSAETENDRYRTRLAHNTPPPRHHPSPSLPVEEHSSAVGGGVGNETSSDRVIEFIKDLRVEERQSGEVSELCD